MDTYDVTTELKEALGLNQHTVKDHNKQKAMNKLNESSNWRVIAGTNTHGQGKITEYKREQLTEKCREYYFLNQLVNRRVELISAFLFGKKVSTYSNVNNDLWQKFWKSQQVEFLLRGFSNRLQVDGEAFPILYYNKQTNTVDIREWDPIEVIDVFTEPDNVRVLLGVKRAWQETTYNFDTDTKQTEGKVKAFKAYEDIPNGSRTILFWKTVSFNNQLRGYSDILPMILPVIYYESLLKYLRNCAKSKSAYAWDCLMKGQDQTGINTRQTNISAKSTPKAGSVISHNESEIWTLLQNNAADVGGKDILRAQLVQVVTGSGLPESLLTGDASNGNYASNKALIEFTTSYTLLEYKNMFAKLITELHDKVMQLCNVTYVVPVEEESVTVTFPEVSSEDLLKLVQANTILLQNQIKSRHTISKEMNLNYDQEQKNLEEEHDSAEPYMPEPSNREPEEEETPAEETPEE